MWAITPFKRFGTAKQRLAGCLDEAERALLARAMLEDVLDALTGVDRLDGIAVVSHETAAPEIGRRHGVRLITETEARGQSRAVSEAVRVLAAEGVDAVLSVPGDVPLVTGAEIERLLVAHAESPALTIVPSQDGTGTNGLVCSPPALIDFSYGDQSFVRHVAAGRGRGVQPTVVELDGLGLDIDAPADLRRLIEAPGATRAQTYLAEAGIAARLRDARPAGSGATLELGATPS